MIYRARKAQMSYGKPIGIIALEENIPCPPGTPGNPTTFSFPVCYELARGVTVTDLRRASPLGVESFVDAGRRLVERGVWAVAGNCGLMLVHQQALAQSLPVPVLLSSLLQVPLIASLYGPDATIGLMVSGAGSLTEQHLALARAGSAARLIVGSMEGHPSFSAAVRDESGELDFGAVTAEVVQATRTLVAQNPSIRALLFECVDLPPYAAAVQAALDLPVFDIVTLIEHFHTALVRRRFEGAY